MSKKSSRIGSAIAAGGLLVLFLTSCTGNFVQTQSLSAHNRHLQTEIELREKIPAEKIPASPKSLPPEITAPPPNEKDAVPAPAPVDPNRLFYSEYSNRLGIPLDGTENKELLMAIDQWMGAPYQWGGCSEIGVDCSCLVKLIYEDVYGISLNRTSLFIYKYDLVQVEPDQLREGDIVFFQIKRKPVSHMGIYLKDNLFFHASQSKGVTISNLNRRYFQKHFVYAGRPILAEMNSAPQLALNDLVVVN